jgi:hypothetical protein
VGFGDVSEWCAMATVYQLGLGRFGLTAGRDCLLINTSIIHVEYEYLDGRWRDMPGPIVFTGIVSGSDWLGKWGSLGCVCLVWRVTERCCRSRSRLRAAFSTFSSVINARRPILACVDRIASVERGERGRIVEHSTQFVCLL